MGIQLTVVTPEGQPYQGEVEQVVLPGSEGDFGVLEQHERFLAALRPGVMEIRGSRDSSSEWAALSDGFADVSGTEVTVLVSHCKLGRELDAASVQGEIGEIEAGLNRLSGSEDDAAARTALEVRLEAARIQLDVAGR